MYRAPCLRNEIVMGEDHVVVELGQVNLFNFDALDGAVLYRPIMR